MDPNTCSTQGPRGRVFRGARGSDISTGIPARITRSRNVAAIPKRRNAAGWRHVMSRGGGRNRSGPQPVEGSRTSERRGFSLTALPAEGYSGPVPEFPLPQATERELAVWGQAWSTPQACAWSMPSEAWRVRTVAMWVRLSVRCESEAAGAALLGQLHRFADQIGMTTAGLAEMGWKVAVDEVSTKRAAQPDQQEAVKVERRLRAADAQ